jgi:hypothetical protein
MAARAERNLRAEPALLSAFCATAFGASDAPGRFPTSTGQIDASSAHKSNVQPLSRSNRAWLPMTGQDAVVDAPAIEREANMRDADCRAQRRARSRRPPGSDGGRREQRARPFALSSARLAASANSAVGASMGVVPSVASGPRYSRFLNWAATEVLQEPSGRTSTAENATIPRRRCSGRAPPGPIGERYRRGAPVPSCDLRLA